AERYHTTIGQRDLQRPERFERCSLHLFSARDDVDQIDAVAYLRHGSIAHDAIQRERHVLGTETELPCLILVDADAHDPGRLDSIRVYVAVCLRTSPQSGGV